VLEEINVNLFYSILYSVVDPDPGWVKISIRIQDEHPGSFFRELRNPFLGLKYLNSLMLIRYPGWKNSDPGWKKFVPIRDPG
jgi:hypothetical protein